MFTNKRLWVEYFGQCQAFASDDSISKVQVTAPTFSRATCFIWEEKKAIRATSIIVVDCL